MRSRLAISLAVACIVPALAAAQTGKPATSTTPTRSTQAPAVHASAAAPSDSTHRVARATTHKATHATSRRTHRKATHSTSSAHGGTSGAAVKHDSTHATTPSTPTKP